MSMDDDSRNQNLESNFFKKAFHNLFNACYVFQPFWVRCAFQDDDGLNRFLLDYGRYFLLYSGSFLWALFFLQ